jgi:hypothetical protein
LAASAILSHLIHFPIRIVRLKTLKQDWSKDMKNCIAIVLALLATSYTASASYSDEKTIAAPDNIERVEVLGQKPLRFYLKEYRLQETAFYDMFNDLIDDSEMQIHCTRVKQFSSNMKKRVCSPRFVSNIERDLTQRGLNMRGASFGGLLGTGRWDSINYGATRAANFEHSEVAALVIDKKAKLADKLNALLETNPELYEQYVKLQQAKQNYDNRLKSE